MKWFNRHTRSLSRSPPGRCVSDCTFFNSRNGVLPGKVTGRVHAIMVMVARTHTRSTQHPLCILTKERTRKAKRRHTKHTRAFKYCAAAAARTLRGLSSLLFCSRERERDRPPLRNISSRPKRSRADHDRAIWILCFAFPTESALNFQHPGSISVWTNCFLPYNILSRTRLLTRGKIIKILSSVHFCLF